MSNLLLLVKANRIRNRTIFAHHLFIYDDLMMFKKRGIIRKHEMTISYNHVSQVYLTRGLIFGTLEIINTGGIESIVVKNVKNKDAVQAKKIIDKKINYAHSKNKGRSNGLKHEMGNIELSLGRLKELLGRKKITSKEYNKKRKELLKRD